MKWYVYGNSQEWHQGQAIDAWFLAGYSKAQISAGMGVPLSVVKSRLIRSMPLRISGFDWPGGAE